MKSIVWRALIVAAVVIAAVVYVIPTFKPGLWPHKQINLGLDLQGGMHLALEVQAEKAVLNTMDRTRSELKTLLRENKIRHGGITGTGNNLISVELFGEDDVDTFKSLLEKNYPDMSVLSMSRENGKIMIKAALKDSAVRKMEADTVQQALETIRNRIDQFGVSEPDIRLQGDRRILIQLPGVKDTRRAKALIGKTAQLEFKLLDETGDLQKALEGHVPPGDEILYESDKRSKGQKKAYLVHKRVLLSGEHLKDARVSIESQYNEPYVSIEFDKVGGRIFEQVTGANVKKRLAIVLDKKVYSAPVIQERISGGSARITGSFSMDEAHDLAIVLRAGALPAPVKIIEERTVGPSLGKDSINKGIISMAVGGVLVVVFMAVYYMLAGLIADIALLLNIVLIGAGLAAFQATLTLPGMAGIILTIGMAVDANVIIFERIREERRLGKTPMASIAAGFDRATVTVLDANVTTLIAALVLYQFGTGPIKGFAVTLSLGVIASLFTALVVCKVIFEYLYDIKGMKTLSI
ncbi:MAG: protein translocase subunit SecD [Deltaproteobacteria bacterium]|nr:protein translocase subunit SecD [Deltaproteobacteria bacterium]